MDVIEKPVEQPKRELQSLKSKVVREPKPIKLEAVELSENIQKFDQKKRVPSPYDYNSISLKQSEESTKPMSEVVRDPLYNGAAKVLGITNVHDWEQDYDKVQFIVDWAKDRTKIQETDRLVSWIYDAAGKAPTVSNRRLDDLFIYAKMGGKGFTPVTKTKVVEKVVKVKQKENSTDQMIKQILQS